MWRVWFAAFLCCAGNLQARSGAVLTLSGETHTGQIRLDTNEVVVVNAARGSSVRVPLTNLLELSFDRPNDVDERNAIGVKARNDWESADVGRARTPGRSRAIGGFYELTVSTHNLPESRHFVYRQVQGDTEIATRVISISPPAGLAGAGLMISEGLSTELPFVAVMITSDGRLVVQARATAESRIDSRTERVASPWLKLKRQGTNISAYHSSDGRRWKVLRSPMAGLSGAVCVGLIATAQYQHESGVSEIRCGFDHLREAPYLVADWFVPRVELESGSIVLGRIRAADLREIRFESVFDPAPVTTRAVSRVMFDWLPPQARIPGGQSGVVLTSGEFVEGAFDSIKGNRLAINSVLFGRRVFDIHGEVAAVVLRPVQRQEPVWELTTNDRSRWLGASLEITKDELGIWDASLGRRTFPAYDLDLVRLVRPATP